MVLFLFSFGVLTISIAPDLTTGILCAVPSNVPFCCFRSSYLIPGTFLGIVISFVACCVHGNLGIVTFTVPRLFPVLLIVLRVQSHFFFIYSTPSCNFSFTWCPTTLM